jgi:acetolactate synthase-1/2/3 large subunit
MNIQELQTIVHHKMDIKIFLINNGGYHSIRQTQHSFFSNHCLVGIGVDSKTDGKCDLSFPDMKKLSSAYGIKYTCIKSNKDVEKVVKSVLSKKGPIICEIFTDTKQAFSPRQTSKKLKSGDIVSLPLEEMSPELDSNTLDELMIVKRVKFE